MFGDKLLVGQYELSIDEKNRIIIPAGTAREKDDLIFVVYDESIDCYKLYAKQAIEEMFKTLKKAILDSKTEEERICNKKEYLMFCKNILRERRVDIQGRVVLGKIVEPGDKVNLIGCGDHFILERKKK